MKIFIIGASGLIGRTLFFTLSKKFRVFGTYNLNKTNKRFIKFDITKDNIDNERLFPGKYVLIFSNQLLKQKNYALFSIKRKSVTM